MIKTDDDSGVWASAACLLGCSRDGSADDGEAANGLQADRALVEALVGEVDRLLALSSSINDCDLLSHLRIHPPRAEVVALLILKAGIEGQQRSRVATARHAAREKNASAIAWVRERWNERADLGQSRAAFATEHAHHVKHQFDLQITPRRIAEHWLKGR